MREQTSSVILTERLSVDGHQNWKKKKTWEVSLQGKYHRVVTRDHSRLKSIGPSKEQSDWLILAISILVILNLIKYGTDKQMLLYLKCQFNIFRCAFFRLFLSWTILRHSKLTSPSGVSDGHNIPHWDGCSERGPLTLRVFSNCKRWTNNKNKAHLQLGILFCCKWGASWVYTATHLTADSCHHSKGRNEWQPWQHLWKDRFH